MVTHDPEEAMFMADRILVMNEGRVVQDGTPVETYFEPVDPFVASFFGPVNRFDGIVENGQISTPLGTFDAPDFAETNKVQVLIRPEGLRLAERGAKPVHNPGDAPCKPAAPVRIEGAAGGSDFAVVSARPLGGASLVVFEVPLADGTATHVEARIPGVFLPAPGSRITATVNANEAHLFPAD